MFEISRSSATIFQDARRKGRNRQESRKRLRTCVRMNTRIERARPEKGNWSTCCRAYRHVFPPLAPFPSKPRHVQYPRPLAPAKSNDKMPSPEGVADLGIFAMDVLTISKDNLLPIVLRVGSVSTWEPRRRAYTTCSTPLFISLQLPTSFADSWRLASDRTMMMS